MLESLRLQPDDELILLASDILPDKMILDRMDALIPKIRDWEAFSKIAINRASAPLMVDKLGRLTNVSQIPENVIRNLKQASLRTLTRNMLLTEHFRQVVQVFGEAGIPIIALKGVLLSEWLYGNINLRQFSDIDLLVPQDQGLEAVEILRKMGYDSNNLHLSEFIQQCTSIVHYKPMVKNGVSIEIHIRLHSENETYQVDLHRMWNQAVALPLHGVKAFSLCPEDLLMHLCFHLDKHFNSGLYQYTCFYDLVNMLNHKSDLLNWDVFEERCDEANTVQVTYKYLLLVHKYMNGRLPSSIVEKYGFLMKRKDERLFLSVLRGHGVRYYTSGVRKTLKNVSGLGKKCRYLFDLFYPSTEFMMQRYRLKHTYQLWLYYPYRHLKGFKSAWQSVKEVMS